MASDKIITVAKHHIERGIEKYKGVVDEHLQGIITRSGYEYTPYLFADGRVLLVLPHNLSALLYPSKKVLFEKLVLDANE